MNEETQNKQKHYCKFCLKEISTGKFCDRDCKDNYYDTKRVRINLSLTENEHKQIKEQAKQLNMTVTTLCKYRVINNRSAPITENIHIIKIKGELGKIGSNINQIARQLNKLNYDKNIPTPDYNELKNQLQSNLKILYQLHDELENIEP